MFVAMDTGGLVENLDSSPAYPLYSVLSDGLLWTHIKYSWLTRMTAPRTYPARDRDGHPAIGPSRP